MKFFFLNTARISATLYENLSVFIITPCWNEKVSDKIVQKININFMFNNFFFFENRPVYGIMWKNMVQPDRHR